MSLARILALARELETSWPAMDRHEERDLSGDPRYLELKESITRLEDPRLSKTAVHLHGKVSLNHFFACIVPIERAANRALRDDEFLVAERDAPEKTIERVPLKVIAENIRSAFNVGALFRTSECLGVSEIVLCGYSPGPDDEKTSRTAMGTSGHVPWRRADRASTACEELRREGYRIVALETSDRAVSLYDFKFGGGPVAFVLGNERFGVERDTLEAVDEICRIPLRGIKNSLNVGIAFGIAAFEWQRQREAAR